MSYFVLVVKQRCRYLVLVCKVPFDLVRVLCV